MQHLSPFASSYLSTWGKMPGGGTGARWKTAADLQLVAVLVGTKWSMFLQARTIDFFSLFVPSFARSPGLPDPQSLFREACVAQLRNNEANQSDA